MRLAYLPAVGNIKVQKEDLKSMGDTSVAFADGSGYLVTVDVFHQLHCLVGFANGLRRQEINHRRTIYAAAFYLRRSPILSKAK